jgi:RimJ/RimL family protein N-acetyltransferase
MKNIPLIQGSRLHLRGVRPEDATERYVGWLNDPEINRYLEVRFSPQTLEGVRAYVEEMADSPDYAFLAIVLDEGKRHIGNIKIGPVNRAHGFADIGIVIGEKDCWGKGYAAEAIALATSYAFDGLGLHRVEAGAYAPNMGSAKAFLKAGWKEEGRETAKWSDGESYVDGIRVACVREK